MVYLEHSGSKFWRCDVDGGTVNTTYGKCGSAGRSVTKEFDSREDAEKYFAKQEAGKRKGGYADADDPSDDVGDDGDSSGLKLDWSNMVPASEIPEDPAEDNWLARSLRADREDPDDTYHESEEEEEEGSIAVYLEHSGSKFWRCDVDGSTVNITYGKCGSAGRSMTKEFDSDEKAEKYFAKQEASKRKGGYSDADDPLDGGNDPSASKKSIPKPNKAATPQKRKAAASASKSSTPTKKAGLGGYAAPDANAASADAMDPGVAGIDGALASRAAVHDEHRARLALVDPAANSDKYYILQMLIDENPPRKRKRGRGGKKKASGGAAEYHVFARWGRTGTGGQAKLDGPFEDEDEAKAAFQKVFKSKTGVDWVGAVAGSEPRKGKYEYLASSFKSKTGVDWVGAVAGSEPRKGKYEYLASVVENSGGADAKWYYYLQKDPMGKPDGWYEYDEENSREVEELYGDYLGSGKARRLATRVVTSETSGFQYRVDLSKMEQVNTSSGTVRPIGRTETGEPPSDDMMPGFEDSSEVEEDVENSEDESGDSEDEEQLTKKSIAGAVDKMASAPLKNGTIYEDYDVMLNQTNLGANNNKFYKMQLVEDSGRGSYHVFTRWGRVGEDGQVQEWGTFDVEEATKKFAEKFRAKSGNSWDGYREDKDSFVSKKGKYTVVEMEQDDEAISATAAALGYKPAAKSELEHNTKDLIDLIFDEDMFKSAMTDMKLDPKKLPLGALSQAQIKKGFAVLERLEDAIDGGADEERLGDITSEFYTLIPHAFGRRAGPVLDTTDKVREKYEMLNTLTDIEAAQSMQKAERGSDVDGDEETRPNPSDLNYEQLAANLTLLDAKKDKDFKLIKTYFDDTKDDKGYGGAMKLQKVWRVDRHDEEKRFAKHADVERRKLLWHGTNVAVVAAILKSGLRIMPHSGGRVGRGIYLADQHQKSAWYTRSARRTTLMFLVEAVLGESHEILCDDPGLTAAPDGFHSVLAKGRKAPPREKKLQIDGRSVAVPQGKPRAVKGASSSSFEHSEFLIYQESQQGSATFCLLAARDAFLLV
eukprot:CAMPEP_0172575658 /NCGR_PEP_ID=MMETSP1067-20121228/137322_1 /TAXON_ID=265564 ORGANISM="Thalassiosira punctigera, Strain Tpunct2005C2" /NCGR_SAMPLE_ID=MMETSP1067 /ASSEMBLY_ACC=CAM_ASM_000444 /LENGTH=1047 /DNA_ID=CAMNT_0013368309 /DNA_START=27 /DNA_END=3169 /DNA_ORIENTATION=-